MNVGMMSNMDIFSWSVIIGIPASLVLAASNGGNGSANSMGTPVGCGAITLKHALLADAIMESLGALTMGKHVASKIADGVIEQNIFQDDSQTLVLIMLSILIGSGFTSLLATCNGYLISTTHGVVSGIVVLGIVSGYQNAIKWNQVLLMVCGWVTSPIVGGICGMLVYYCILYFVLDQDRGERNNQKTLPHQLILLTLTTCLIFLFIFLKGPPFISDYLNHWCAFPISLLCGGITTAIYQVYVSVCYQNENEQTYEVLHVEQRVLSSDLEDYGSLGEISPKGDDQSSSTIVHEPLQQSFIPLLNAASYLVSFAHGSNDIGNSFGPLFCIISHKLFPDSTPPSSSSFATPLLFLVTLAFVAGIFSFGSRTITLVGSKITNLVPSRSYSAQVSTAIAVLVGSATGLPVSTSHCLIGSMVGVQIAEAVYAGGGVNIEFKTLKKIVLGWVVTIPISAISSSCIFVFFKWLFISK